MTAPPWQKNANAVVPPCTDPDAGDFEILEKNPTQSQEEIAIERGQLQNASLRNDLEERKKFSRRAFRFACFGAVFMVSVTSVQFIWHRLSEHEFMTLTTTTMASIFGFWHLVGRYLFRPDPPASPRRPASQQGSGRRWLLP